MNDLWRLAAPAAVALLLAVLVAAALVGLRRVGRLLEVRLASAEAEVNASRKRVLDGLLGVVGATESVASWGIDIDASGSGRADPSEPWTANVAGGSAPMPEAQLSAEIGRTRRAELPEPPPSVTEEARVSSASADRTTGARPTLSLDAVDIERLVAAAPSGPSTHVEARAVRARTPSYFDRLVAINVDNLGAYYALVKVHANASFLASVGAGVTGFALVLAGLVFAVVTNDQQLGLVSTASGVITEFISAVFFTLYSRTVRQLKEYHDSLLDVQRLLLGFRLIDDTHDQAARSAMADELLRYLAPTGGSRDGDHAHAHSRLAFPARSRRPRGARPDALPAGTAAATASGGDARPAQESSPA